MFLLFYYSSSLGIEARLPWLGPAVRSPFRQYSPRTTLKILSCPSHASQIPWARPPLPAAACLLAWWAWFPGTAFPAVSLGPASRRCLSCSNPLQLEMERSQHLGSDLGPQTFANRSLKWSRSNAHRSWPVAALLGLTLSGPLAQIAAPAGLGVFLKLRSVLPQHFPPPDFHFLCLLLQGSTVRTEVVLTRTA